MILAALALAQAAATPSVAAVDLGIRLARTGSIMALLPLTAKQETEDLVAAHPELSDADKRRLRAVADATFRDGMARIERSFGLAYARHFSAAELRVLVAQAERPEQRRLRAAQPQVMREALAALGTLDFKKDVTTAFCRDAGDRAGKLCAK